MTYKPAQQRASLRARTYLSADPRYALGPKLSTSERIHSISKAEARKLEFMSSMTRLLSSAFSSSLVCSVCPLLTDATDGLISIL